MYRAMAFLLAATLLLSGSAIALSWNLAFASSILHEDDDECDSSGPGSGDCDEDRDDDHSGPGHGGDEVDDDEAAATQQPEGQLEVRIIDKQFVPASLTVKPGDTVTFVNADDDQHTATGTSFDTGTLNPGDSATVTFDEAGKFSFVCQFHSQMRGEIVVTGDEDAATPPARPSPVLGSPIAEASPAASTVDIKIIDFRFESADISVPPGTTVTWTNTGAAPHTVTGDFADSGLIEPGKTFSFTFDEPGTFDYACALHPQMVGAIVVDPDAPPPGG
jgi:plastocyanin